METTQNQESAQRPVRNLRVEAKVKAILDSLKIPWTHFDGVLAIIDQPARLVNLVNLFAQVLNQADEVIEGMHNSDPHSLEWEAPVVELLNEWKNPPKIEVVKPPKKPRKKG